MAFDPVSAFELLRESYRSGLLDELVAIAGQALDGLIENTGLGVGDLLALLDSVPRETVLGIEERAASSNLEEVAADLNATARDPGEAAGALQRYLEQAVAKAGAGLPGDGGAER